MKIEGMTILITGGCGFIGSALVRLLASQAQVRVLDDLSTGKAVNLDGVTGVDLRIGSILDLDTVAKAVDGIDVIFHLACLGVRHSIGHPMENHAVNALGTLNLLEEARRRGVRKLVYTSSSEIYGTAVKVPMDEDHPPWPHTVYGAAKLAGEAYVRAYHRTYGLPTVILRPFNAFGPRSHHEGDSGEVIPKFLVRAMNGLPPIVFGDGQQTRDFTYVEDTVGGIAAAAEREEAIGETINLGSGREITVLELAKIVARVTGVEVEPVFEKPRPGDVLRLYADSRRAEQLLGWRAQTDLGTGMQRLLAWWQQQGTDWAAALREDIPLNWQEEA